MRSRASIKSHPIHPMLVAFPIGLWIAGFLFDLIALWRDNSLLWAVGWFAILGGCIGAAAAAVPGVIDLFGVVPPNSSAKKRGYLHGGLNTAILLLFIAVLAYRGNSGARPDGLAILLELIGVGALMVSGWLGATLVYRNQIGIDHRYANAGQWKQRELDSWDRPVCNIAELSDGQMMLAEIEGTRVVVGRCSEGMFAFSDHCTHRGGPLSDGALVGCTVQCPWHGSQFDLKSGRVVSGPAERRIDTFDVQVRGGEVYVKKPAVHRQPEKTDRAA